MAIFVKFQQIDSDHPTCLNPEQVSSFNPYDDDGEQHVEIFMHNGDKWSIDGNMESVAAALTINKFGSQLC